MSLEVDEIRRICKENLKQRPYVIYLYGSRVTDQLRGGDIDLYLLADQWPKEDQNKIHRLLAVLKFSKIIGDRKINLSLVTENEKVSDPFWMQITNTIEIGKEI